MAKVRVFFLLSGFFFIAFAFVFMIGTSLLGLIPFLNGIVSFSGENYTIHYGLDFFKYVVTHIPQTYLFADPWCGLPNGLLLLYFAFIDLIVIALAVIKKRIETMFYAIPIMLLGLGLTSLNALLFGFSLYDGQIRYNYFQLFILNSDPSASIFARVCFIVIFVCYIFLIISIFVFWTMLFAAPRRSKRYMAWKYERQFTSVKDVRKVSNEEIQKYILEHKEEIKGILGIHDNPPQKGKSIEEITNEALDAELQKAIANDPNSSITVEANGIKKEYDPTTKEIKTSKVEEKPIETPADDASKPEAKEETK